MDLTQRALILRRHGHPHEEIAALLGVEVAAVAAVEMDPSGSPLVAGGGDPADSTPLAASEFQTFAEAGIILGAGVTAGDFNGDTPPSVFKRGGIAHIFGIIKVAHVAGAGPLSSNNPLFTLPDGWKINPDGVSPFTPVLMQKVDYTGEFNAVYTTNYDFGVYLSNAPSSTSVDWMIVLGFIYPHD